MKKLTLTLVFILTTFFASAQLNNKAEVMRKDSSGDFVNKIYKSIRAEAVHKWGDNNKMIVYEINKQVDDWYAMFIGDIEKYVKKDKKRFFKYCIKWRGETKGSTNWSMVKYEIDNDEKNSDY